MGQLEGLTLRRVHAADLHGVAEVIRGRKHRPGDALVELFAYSHPGSFFEDDGLLWFVDRDVLRVLDKEPTSAMRIAYGEVDYKPIGETGMMAFSDRVVVRVVSLIRHPDAGKFKFWIEREVIAPHHKKREIAGLRAPSR